MLGNDWITSYLTSSDTWGRKGLHVCRSLDLIYIETPKCASTSVKANLLRLAKQDYGSHDYAELHNIFERVFPSAESIPDEERTEILCRVKFIFSVVRNPYTRILSGFADKVKRASPRRAERLRALGLDPIKDIVLTDFLAAIRNSDPFTLDTHWRPQAILIRPSLVPYTHILRFENLTDQLFRMLCDLRGIDDPVEGLVRRGTQTHIGIEEIEQIAESNRDMIKKIYNNDFQLFKYDT